MNLGTKVRVATVAFALVTGGFAGTWSAAATAAPPAPVSATPSAANDVTPLAGLLLRNYKTAYCLDSNANGHVYTNPCQNRNVYQRWYNNGFTYVNEGTGRCLDSNNLGHVYTLSCNNGMNQKWYNTNHFEIQNYATGRCLDSNDKQSVYTQPCNRGDYQKWYQQ